MDPYTDNRADFSKVVDVVDAIDIHFQVMAKKEYEDRVALGHKLDEFVIYCAYDGRECDLKKLVQILKKWTHYCRDFSAAVWNDYYGACYTFGGQKPASDNQLEADNQKMVTGAGSVYGEIEPPRKLTYVSLGLNLILDTQSAEHLNRLTEEMGVRVLLHDSAEMPFPDEAGFSVPANMEALVSVGIVCFVTKCHVWLWCQPLSLIQKLFD